MALTLQDMREGASDKVAEQVVDDVQWIDDPMGMHEHLEIYLKAVGGVGSGTD